MKTKKINYNSKKFLRGLKKVRDKIEKEKNNSIRDREKMHINFDI